MITRFLHIAFLWLKCSENSGNQVLKQESSENAANQHYRGEQNLAVKEALAFRISVYRDHVELTQQKKMFDGVKLEV